MHRARLDRSPSSAQHEVGVPPEALKQLGQMLTQDSLLRPLDRLLNENPFHNVIPIDWAEIARRLQRALG